MGAAVDAPETGPGTRLAHAGRTPMGPIKEALVCHALLHSCTSVTDAAAPEHPAVHGQGANARLVIGCSLCLKGSVGYQVPALPLHEI
jgi:hypothetical protein